VLGTAAGTATITNDDTISVAYPPTGALTSTVKGSITLTGAEIPAFDAVSKRAFAASPTGIQVVNLADPAAPAFISTITPATLGVSGLTSNDISSVAVRKGSGGNPSVLAAAIISVPKTNPGFVIFLDAATGALLGSTNCGANPDHIAFTPDGTKLLVANEGELDGTAATIPDTAMGSISIIPVNAAGVPGTVSTADFTAFDSQTAALKAAGVRIFGAGVPSTDFEPEYFAISADSTKAMVTLQEANAVAVLDIPSATFTSVAPLGKKSFASIRTDVSDRDGAAASNLINPVLGNPVFGLYMPDAIASYSAGGQTYYVTANEGDDRNDFLNPDETTTVSNAGYILDPTVFPNAATLKTDAVLGRLVVSNFTGLRGDTDNDGDIDEILSYGARSFSILDSAGNIVFDSGDMIEMIVASQFPTRFDDARSDNKGPEPEGVTIATLGARTYAFVGLERSHMTLVFDVTNPAAVTFTGGMNRTGDLNPEGLTVISATDSPTGKPLLLVANEVSNTLTIFEIDQPTDYTLQVLHLADGEAGLLASQTAPNLAALVDAFDGAYPNTLILAGGDNFIPGPFLAGGTDASVRTALNTATGSTIPAGTNAPIAAVDIALHSLIGVEASTIGNHEFDLGSNVFRASFTPASVTGWVGANFPYLSANLDFSGDADLSPRFTQTLSGNATTLVAEASTLKGRIAPAAVITRNGEKIGLVAATTQLIEGISSPSGTEVMGFPTGAGPNGEIDDMDLLASQLQPAIDELISEGVDKIIVMAHLQRLDNERSLATKLRGVDVILAAGSNTRLGDTDDVPVVFPGHGADFADNYPIITSGVNGQPTLIVNTDNEYTYLGRLVVNFDADGVVILGDLPATRPVNGAYAATSANVTAAWGAGDPFATGTKGALVKSLTDAVQAVINTKDGDVAGFTNVYLQGERIAVRNQETNLGNITADANIAVLEGALGNLAPSFFIASLKNGGGIRAQIGTVSLPDPVTGLVTYLPPPANPGTTPPKPAGGVSLLDIENSLRFNNTLMAFETTPAGLKAILEHGVASLGNQGRFPQIGGLRFSFDGTLAVGSRVRNVVFIDKQDRITARFITNGSVDPAAPATLRLVTLNFLANGGDGYPMKANGENFRFILNTGTRQAPVLSLSAPIDEALNYTAAGVVPANVLGEQVAMFIHMAQNHPSAGTAFNVADTAQSADTRIQNLAARTDGVGTGTQVTTFAGWLAANGFTTSTGLAGDTDNDGVPDSLEYFFNASPNSGGDRDNLPTVTVNGNDLEFRFTYLSNTVFPGYLQCSEDLVAWVNATPGLDYEVITETVNGNETAVRFRIFCNPLPTTQGPFTYLTPFTAAVGRGAIDQLTITNHGMVGAGRLSGDSYDSFGETMGAASGLSITGWNYNSGTGQFSGVFNVLPDRGYNSGTIFSNYAARIHQTPFTFTPYYGAGPVPQTQIVPTYGSTTKFTYLDGATMKFTTGLNATAVTTIMGQSVGTTAAANGPGGATENLISFDAEAIHVFADGSGFVSDEYGTYIARFNAAKQFTRIIQLPAAAQPHKPVGTLNFDSTTAPTNGRRNNQGLEGMAVSPDNSRLFALMQSALVQDTGAGNQGRFNTRLFVYDIAGANLENPVLIGEYAVQLPRYDLNGNNSGLDTTAAQSEIVALSNTQLLMLPRDGNGLGKGDTNPPVVKTVDLVDFSTATNILGLYDAEGNQISPSGTLRTTITPARSTVVVNLLSSTDLAKFGFNTNTAAPNQFTVNEKAEGMALVPDTSTASTEDYFLFVANDNDFQSSDVRMIDAAGNLVSYGDARDRGITNDAVFTAWRITICPNNRKFFRIQVDTAP
jgi:2',3'-cyclic-nucleotide 2'-phosphodiesterase (5'-nucleotidase family)